ncbi:TIGR04283 family arsenosugar biosynthesis glycosyltransferase [bacterium]|nr:TIGR04283 family arsenosugar biosynthesis glycosyltransferase [bacterium]
MKQISIVIPTLNEQDSIARTVSSVLGPVAIEVIVADGSSTDSTAEKALIAGAQVVVSDRGRGLQMNAGSQIASGEVLLFLHADTLLPKNYNLYIEQVLSDKRNVAGGFRLGINSSVKGLRMIEWGANWRSKYQQMIYGDQAIFVRRETFNKIGGFANIPLMEDVDLINRLKLQGRIVLADAAIKTSARRWQRLGVVRTTLYNQFFRLAYGLGVKPETLAQWYKR